MKHIMFLYIFDLRALVVSNMHMLFFYKVKKEFFYDNGESKEKHVLSFGGLLSISRPFGHEGRIIEFPEG
jgi:hypothetical protein